MGVGDIYQIIDVQTLYGQQVLNVYYYEQRYAIFPLGDFTIAAILANEFVEQKLDNILAVQAPALNHDEVRCINLFDEEDFGVVVTNVPGELPSGETLPTYASYSTQFKIDTRAIRPGSKRICGLQEEHQVAGIIVDEDLIAALEDMDYDLSLPITGGLIIQDQIWWPCVVKRIKEEDEEGHVIYRLPRNTLEAVFAQVTEVLTSLVLGTQNTRKRGRGA